MSKLYRLKSNKGTIVERDGNFHKVFWTRSMERVGYDATWMMSAWADWNTQELSESGAEEIREKRKEFDKTRNSARMSGK